MFRSEFKLLLKFIGWLTSRLVILTAMLAIYGLIFRTPFIPPFIKWLATACMVLCFICYVFMLPDMPDKN